MAKLKHLFKLVTAHKLMAGIAAGVLVIGGAFAAFGGNAQAETAEVKQADLVRTVRISGKVAPREKVDLGFEVAGTVASVGKEVGQNVFRGETLVRLDAGALAADVKKAEAELASAKAELAKLEGTQAFENDVTSAKRSVIQAIKDAYTAATDAVQNKADQVFVNPRSANPQIIGYFQGENGLIDTVSKGRVSVGYVLADWQKLVSALGTESYSSEQIELSKKYLDQTNEFIGNVSAAVNMFEPTAYMTQSAIDQYKADLLSAREKLNAAASGFITAEGGLSASLSDVPVQLARVEAAEANLVNLRYRAGKTALTSPIQGLVSFQEAKVGQAVSAGTTVVSVISPDYIIEAYIPEVSIGGVALGNSAAVTFDAYGPNATFAASVAHIDPAETIKDGVSTYKVKLSFTDSDERIRSGLTSNVSIETLRKPSATLVPERAIKREGDKAYATLLTGKTEEKVEVTLGGRDSQGAIEVLSGLSAGDQVLINP